MPDFIFIDAETRSPVDVTVSGLDRLAVHPESECTVWAWAFDDQPANVWSPPWAWAGSNGKPDKEPTALLDAIEDGAYFVAWNARFDRLMYNAVMPKKYGWPELRLNQVLCAQAQAEASLLPGQLGKAALAAGVEDTKDTDGKRLIDLLARGTRDDWPDWVGESGDMAKFRAYGVRDVLAMRGVWNYCRPLLAEEWEQYHASEAVNDRGVGVDIEFATAGAKFAVEESRDLNEILHDITGDARVTLTNHVRKAQWLHSVVSDYDEALAQVITKPGKKKKDPRKPSLDKERRGQFLDLINQPEHADNFPEDTLEDVTEFVETIEAGNSAAVHKFKAMIATHVNGRVHGQYSWNGAGATGRFSSRGIQIHNLIRDPVKKKDPDRALDAMDDIMSGMQAEALTKKYGHSPSRLLARLIRPTFIAAPGKKFVWSDWAQIEARILPWLSDSRGGQVMLDRFASSEDVYVSNAMDLFYLQREEVDDAMRQTGKVLGLACQFGGSVGALSAMERGYSMVIDDKKARVDRWRDVNKWAVNFWYELKDAAIDAYQNPGVWFDAGMVSYLFAPALMHGTLVCRLPSGRYIVYPRFRYGEVPEENEDGEIEYRLAMTYSRQGGTWRAWHGTFAENVTQAVGADFLRELITRVDPDDSLVFHTHDEALLEVDEDEADEAAVWLTAQMEVLPDWANGFPIEAETETGYYYTK